ncbi:MAG: T9SS type A sorting domain-containing protein, partial [Saprospiraceae bacterium]|nr:T9SS type A sorting domain-containing protein [Saprospiraceae bacterium]
RQIDNDGTETLSKAIAIQVQGSKDKLKAYPSVTHSILTIETDATGDYHILNLLGQTVVQGKVPSETWGLDVSTLPQGSYVVKVGVEQVKFVKQ